MAERFFYFLGATVAVALLCPWPPPEEEFGEDLIRIWDEQKYTPADVVDFAGMADRLKPHVSKYAAKDPAVWLPKSPSRRRRR